MADCNELLREAVCIGNIQTVKNLIQSGRASVNSQNTINGWTALHWAVKREHIELVEYLLLSGADPLIKSYKGETPNTLTSNETILQLLPARSTDTTMSSLPIVPNYLRNPTFPYNDMICTQSQVNVSSTTNQLSDLQISTPSNDTTSNDSLKSNGFNNTLVLKVRIADSGESDFVEVDVHSSSSYQEVLRSCCEELEVSLDEVSKLRKLPNVLVRKDRDIARLDNGQELELVLKGTLSSES